MAYWVSCICDVLVYLHILSFAVFGLRRSTQVAKYVRENLPTRCYQIKCILGQATDNGFAYGKVVERSTWRHVKQFHLDRILSAMQAAHQKKMFEYVLI